MIEIFLNLVAYAIGLVVILLFFVFIGIVIPEVFGHAGHKIDEYNQRDDDD